MPWRTPALKTHSVSPFRCRFRHPLPLAQALYHAHALSEGGQRHITIADLSQGVIHPSKVSGQADADALFWIWK